VSADGRSIAAVPLTVRTKIWTTTLSSPDAVHQLAGGGVNDGAQGLAWTADGRIAFSDQTSVAWIVKADGSGLQPLTPTRNRAWELAPCASVLTYSLMRGERVGIYLIDPQKGIPQEVAEGAAGLRSYPACAPDGQTLFFTSGRDLMKVAVGGTPSVFAAQTHEGRVSPDGKLLAAHRVITPGKETFALYDVSTGARVRDLPGAERSGFQWTPDGSALIAIAVDDKGIGNLERVPIDGSARSLISHFTETDRLMLLAVNNDGRVAFSRGTADNDVILLTVGR
jgi:WD40 repeat protein